MKKLLLVALVAFALTAHSQNAANLDTSFGTAGRVYTDFNSNSELGNAMTLQSDGKIILAGTGIVTTANSYDFCVARYNTDGSLDTTFGTNGKANFEITNFSSSTKRDYATGVVMQTDGKIVVSGYCPNSNFSSAQNYFAVIRLNANGTLDTTYATNGILKFGFGTANCQANALAIQADNKVVVAGYSETGSSDYDYAIARINTDGTLDTDFSNDGKVTISFDTYDKAQAVTIQSDGKIVVGGDANGKYGLLRFTEFGTLDTTFATTGKVTTDLAGGSENIVSIGIQSDNKIVCGGTRYNSGYNFLVARYNADGTLDTNFGTAGFTTLDIDTASEDLLNGIALQSDGKIIMVGSCITNGVEYFAVTRFTTGGVLDANFSGDGIQLTTMTGSEANAVCIQTDGKIVVGGGNYLSGGTTGNFALARYLGDSFLETNRFDFNNSFLCYPNPVKDNLHLSLSNNDLIEGNYEILDVNGRVISTGKLEQETNQINVENLSKGIYFLKLNNLNKKFIKE